MAIALGVICEKSGIQYTLVRGTELVVEEETELQVPASRDERGDQLNWLLEEAEGVLRRLRPDVAYVKKAIGGQFASSPERHEVEGLVQVAAHRVGVPCHLRTTDQIRAVHGPRARGAYEALLKRPDVKARSNKDRRERYLYAVTALVEQGYA